MLFVASLGGTAGLPPTDAQVDQALGRMVDAIREGRIGPFAAYDPQGRPLPFD